MRTFLNIGTLAVFLVHASYVITCIFSDAYEANLHLIVFFLALQSFLSFLAQRVKKKEEQSAPLA